ncbi:hypothetical protein KIH27_12720 [Mycobacterium sp. M1]|uniref:CDGP domain-containing protein n=1 Tax=Mycolicibacter acidiphilus TaxID=2835306 RepID=A0ABS5RJR7_9MYCO|nr:hypothetical protein [Mycolicibacter acidiphilus]MBS9534449.1 hypothetical protein [Mycolicibacter acidiphilus]
MTIALLTAPSAAAQPGGVMPSNCLPGTYGQLVYCDEDVNPDGSWVRCSRPTPEPMTVFGGMAGSTTSGPASCQLVKPNALPAGSPPYHIGYGGEATGRV